MSLRCSLQCTCETSTFDQWPLLARDSGQGQCHRAANISAEALSSLIIKHIGNRLAFNVTRYYTLFQPYAMLIFTISQLTLQLANLWDATLQEFI